MSDLHRPLTRMFLGLIASALIAACLTATARAQSTTREPRPGRARAGQGSSGRLRASDRRPRPDAERLAGLGIQKYESRRLILYTDLPPDDAEPLPALMDAAYEAWEAYFGPLPPDREGSDFQMTGYLMVDQAPFRTAGLLPDDLPQFDHGRHRGQEFWLNDQSSAYYREHLLLHEGTHCFTTCVEHGLLPRVWYIEGIAEHFATHRRDAEGNLEFRVLPELRSNYLHLGRIKLIEEQTAQRAPATLRTITGLPPERFLQPDAYAWSWGLCHFLDQHPRYRDAFRQATRIVVEGGDDRALRELLATPGLDREWQWFATDLCHGYDLERAAIPLAEGAPLKAGEEHTVHIAADRGWQSSSVRLLPGKRYLLTATGRFRLANGPKPWISEANGVSLRYHAGRPLGRLVGRLWTDGQNPATPIPTLDLGSRSELEVDREGTLYLRLNDAWNELADNDGEVAVTLVELP